MIDALLSISVIGRIPGRSMVKWCIFVMPLQVKSKASGEHGEYLIEKDDEIIEFMPVVGELPICIGTGTGCAF